jgi:hypothetical protein
MRWPSLQQNNTRYWIRVYLLYVAFEASVQLFFLVTLNIFEWNRISDIEVHLLMWIFQCVLILPIWWVAYLFRGKEVWQQVIANSIFFILYTFFWYGPVMQWLATLHVQLQQITQPNNTDRVVAVVDTWTFFHYQLLKHAWRLGWFFVADFFYHYKREEKQRLALLVANKELQLSLIKWHLNPDFYFKTINTIARKARQSPADCSELILNLSKVMEYVIYRSREKLIPVTEEISFLQNYISLQNLGNEHGKEYIIRVHGDHSHLSIIPLLLVSLLEGQMRKGDYSGKTDKCIDISFSSQTMKVNGDSIQADKNDSLHPSLQLRLQEFYHNKYRFAYETPGKNWFEIQLTETN